MEIKVGTRVGLNKSKRQYYFQGENGINLRDGIDDTVIIPENISDYNLDMISKSVNAGHLVVGWSPEVKPDVRMKEDDRKLLDKGYHKMVPFLNEIFETKGTGSESPSARLEKLLAQEKGGKNRKSVIEKIEYFLGKIGGVSRIVEEDKEEIKINLV
jgi:hypothetical protein